jgi:hypothetical protein
MPLSPLSPENGPLPGITSGAPVNASTAGNDLLLDGIAAGLYHFTSMLLGEGEDTIGIVEEVVTRIDLHAGETMEIATHNARLDAAGRAVALLAHRDPAAFAVSAEDSGPASCIEDEELDAAGVSRVELEHMLTGSDQRHLRGWLESLPDSLRVIFVLRAVAGASSPEVARVLAEHGGPQAQDWTPGAVGSTFRQALCSLASQLLHASNAT